MDTLANAPPPGPLHRQPQRQPQFWADRIRASSIHLGLSLAIAALAALLVFGLWYPYPYREISGGRELFMLLVSVDVVLGPLITLAIFNRVKPWPVLRRDLMVVGLLQLGALGYGLWTVAVARPVHLVFEYYRFNVAHAIEIPKEDVDKTAPGIVAMPWSGPTVVSLRPFKSRAEDAEITLAAAMGGVGLEARPQLWQPYLAASEQIKKEAKPLALLKTRFAAQTALIEATVAPFGTSGQQFVYLPMVARQTFWTVLLDPASLEVKAFLPLDSF